MVVHTTGANQPGILFLHNAANHPKEVVLPIEPDPGLASGSAPNEMNKQAEVFSSHDLCRPFGPRDSVFDCDHDLTVVAISVRPLGPNSF